MKPGDVVILKAVGTRMTIESVKSPTIVHCVWFSGPVVRRDDFLIEDLELAA